MSLWRTPTPGERLLAELLVPPVTPVVATIPWSGFASLESATTELRKMHEFVFSPTTDRHIWLPCHLRLQAAPKTLWNALTSSCVENA